MRRDSCSWFSFCHGWIDDSILGWDENSLQWLSLFPRINSLPYNLGNWVFASGYAILTGLIGGHDRINFVWMFRDGSRVVITIWLMFCSRWQLLHWGVQSVLSFSWRFPHLLLRLDLWFFNGRFLYVGALRLPCFVEQGHNCSSVLQLQNKLVPMSF